MSGSPWKLHDCPGRFFLADGYKHNMWILLLQFELLTVSSYNFFNNSNQYQHKRKLIILNPCTSVVAKTWAGTAYFGASMLALERLVQHFGYSTVCVQDIGLNIFFVHNSAIGGISLGQEVTDTKFSYQHEGFHNPCPDTAWLLVSKRWLTITHLIFMYMITYIF